MALALVDLARRNVNINKTRSKLAIAIYKLSCWVAPKLDITPTFVQTEEPDEVDPWADTSNFGEKPF